MARQSDATKLLAVGLLNHADDHGYFFADPAAVRSSLRPFDDDSTIVRRSLDDLSRIGYIETRKHPTHGVVGFIVSFSTHQRVDRPKDSIIKELFDSTINRRSIDDQSSLEGKGKEQGMEGNGVSSEQSGKPDSSKPARKQKLSDDEFLAELPNLYPHCDVESELRKMDAWILANPGRKKTRGFIVRWLNKIDPGVKATSTEHQRFSY